MYYRNTSCTSLILNFSFSFVTCLKDAWTYASIAPAGHAMAISNANAVITLLGHAGTFIVQWIAVFTAWFGLFQMDSCLRSRSCFFFWTCEQLADPSVRLIRHNVASPKRNQSVRFLTEM